MPHVAKPAPTLIWTGACFFFHHATVLTLCLDILYGLDSPAMRGWLL